MSEKESPSSSKVWVTIITALIGMLGTMAVAYFSYREIVAPKELEISATQTAEARLPLPNDILTPTIFVNVPNTSPDESLSTSTPAFPPQQDFSTNCINATTWTPYTEIVSYAQANNCWDLTKSGILAQDGKLIFIVQNDILQSSSLYTIVPKEGRISFIVKIDKFVSGKTNGNLAFGVGTANNWFLQGDFLFFRSTDSGYYIVYGNSIDKVGKRTIDSYQLGSDILVSFQFNDLAFDIYINNLKVVSNVLLSASTSPVFWIGYKLPEKSELVASISDFRIER